MAPRIRNISADEFRRLFQAPEIQAPGLTVSDAINLSGALEQRQQNEEQQKLRLAQIERRIAEEEAKTQDIQQEGQLGQLLSTPAQAPETIQTPQGAIPTPGPIEDIERNIAEAERQQEIEGLRTQLDPLGSLAAAETADAEAASLQTKQDFELEQIREKGRQDRLMFLQKQKQKTVKEKKEQSALEKEVMGDERRTNIITNTAIEKALPLINESTTGVIAKGQERSGLAPKSEAAQLARFLDTVKANVGFGKLNAMRAASPTGGALGQVSEREITFLQASEGSLEQFQRPEELKKTITEIKNSKDRILVLMEVKQLEGFDKLSDAEQKELYDLMREQRGIPKGK